MRKGFIILSILCLTSCSDQEDAVVSQLNSLNQILDTDLKSIKNEISKTVGEYGLSATPNIQRDNIDSVFQVYNDFVMDATSGEIDEIPSKWNTSVNKIFTTEQQLNVVPQSSLNLTRAFYKHELRFKTKKVYEELLKSIIPQDMTFDNIRLLFVPEINELTFGESYIGEVHFGISSSAPEQFIDFYFGEEKLEFANGYAPIEIRPNRRGKFTIEVEARGKPNSKVTQGMKFEGSTSFMVR